MLLKSSYLLLLKQRVWCFLEVFSQCLFLSQKQICRLSSTLAYGVLDNLLMFGSSDQEVKKLFMKINKRTQGNKSELFCLHSFGSMAYSCRSLIIKLSRDQIQDKRQTSMQKHSSVQTKITQISKYLAKCYICPVVTSQIWLCYIVIGFITLIIAI